MNGSSERDGSERFADVLVESAALRRAYATHPQRMKRLSTQLGARVGDKSALFALAARVVGVAVEFLGSVQWAALTAELDQRRATLAVSNAGILRTDAYQFDAGAPGAHALASAACVHIPDIQHVSADLALPGSRGLEFAHSAGVSSILAVPMASDHTTMKGVLMLYGAERGLIAGLDRDLLTVLADVVARALGDYEVASASHAQALVVTTALARKVAIAHCIGALMAVYDTDEFLAEQELDAAVLPGETLSQAANRLLEQFTVGNN